MKTNSVVGKKAYAFAIDIIKTYKLLIKEEKEYVLSKQLLRSGTSIGANINEALSAQSKRDFVHKLSISLKEARETDYWLWLLKDSDYISPKDFENLNNICTELKKMLSIILTTKQKYFSVKDNTNKTH